MLSLLSERRSLWEAQHHAQGRQHGRFVRDTYTLNLRSVIKSALGLVLVHITSLRVGLVREVLGYR